MRELVSQPSGHFWVVGYQAHIPSFLGWWLYCFWAELGGTRILLRLGSPELMAQCLILDLFKVTPLSWGTVIKELRCLGTTSFVPVSLWSKLSVSSGLLKGQEELLALRATSLSSRHWSSVTPLPLVHKIHASCDYHHGWEVWRIL